MRGLAGFGSMLLGVFTGCSGDPEDVADPTKCGPAPHVQVTGHAMLYGLTGTSTAVGAHFTSDLCPTKDFVTDLGGRFTAGFARDTSLTLEGRFEGSFPVRSGELVLTEDLEASGYFIPKALRGLFPEEFDDSSGMLVASVNVEAGATGACADRSGVVVTLPGSTSVYFKGDTVPELDRTLQATGPIGLMATVRTPDPEPIQATAHKTGCTVDFEMAGQTGRARFQAGTLTGLAVRLAN